MAGKQISNFDVPNTEDKFYICMKSQLKKRLVFSAVQNYLLLQFSLQGSQQNLILITPSVPK